MKWTIELSEFDIKYIPAKTIKALAMANFLANLTPREKIKDVKKEWKVFVDDSFSKKGGGIGIIIIRPDQEKIEHAGHLAYEVTNNEAGYEVFLANLKIAKFLGIENLTIMTTSQLIVKQAQGDFCIKDQRMMACTKVFKKAMEGWTSIKMKLIDISNNEEENALAKIGASPCPNKGTWIQVETVTSQSTVARIYI